VLSYEKFGVETYVKQGNKSARAMNRARILLLADEQHSDEEIMETLGVRRQTVYTVRKKYQQHQGKNILALLQEKPRPGQPVKIDTHVESHVAMIACAAAPEGAARWTLPMIADRLVELKVVDSICAESVRKALKKMHCNPGGTNAGVSARFLEIISGIWKMSLSNMLALMIHFIP
jgi:transposase